MPVMQMHRRFGRLPWAQLVAPAADLARKGFATHPYLVYVLAGPLSFQRIQVIGILRQMLSSCVWEVLQQLQQHILTWCMCWQGR
jgi:hypothetical protein